MREGFSETIEEGGKDETRREEGEVFESDTGVVDESTGFGEEAEVCDWEEDGDEFIDYCLREVVRGESAVYVVLVGERGLASALLFAAASPVVVVLSSG